MKVLIQASLAGPVGDRLSFPRERDEASGNAAVTAEERDNARFRSERAARQAEQMRQYLPIGDDEMPA